MDAEVPLDRPRVTIAMPTRNAARTLALALRSVRAQTLADWELLLIDDGSTDATLAIARGFADPRIRILADGRHLGLAARLNQAIDLARGAYLARLDGDDLAYPERLARQVALLEREPALDLVGSGAVVFDDNGRAVGRFPAPATHAAICARPWSGFKLAHPSWTGRLAWFARHRYRDAMRISTQDQDLLLRAWRSSTFANLPEPLIGYRQARLDARKFARGRVQFARAALRQARIERAPGAAVRVLLEQTAKGVYESAAIATGLGRRLLGHRALPLDEPERARWEAVWLALGAADR